MSTVFEHMCLRTA